MYFFVKSVVLLTLVSLGGCSVARHGPVSVGHPRINWPRPEHLSRHQPHRHPINRHDLIHPVHKHKHAGKATYARNLAGDGGIQVRYPQPGVMPTDSYKIPRSGRWGSMLPPVLVVQYPGTVMESLNRRPAPASFSLHSLTNKIN